MPKVSLPGADWLFITLLLEDDAARGGVLSGPLLSDINAQLDRQEA